MKFVWLMSLVLVLVGFAQAEAAPAQTVSRAKKQCDEASSQAETFGCYFNLAARSRAEVDRAFERDLQSAIVLDKELGVNVGAHGMSGSSLAERLRDSQAAWITYSDAQCTFEGRASFGGSGEDILDAECRYRLNSSRLMELESARDLFNR